MPKGIGRDVAATRGPCDQMGLDGVEHVSDENADRRAGQNVRQHQFRVRRDAAQRTELHDQQELNQIVDEEPKESVKGLASRTADTMPGSFRIPRWDGFTSRNVARGRGEYRIFNLTGPKSKVQRLEIEESEFRFAAWVVPSNCDQINSTVQSRSAEATGTVGAGLSKVENGTRTNFSELDFGPGLVPAAKLRVGFPEVVLQGRLFAVRAGPQA